MKIAVFDSTGVPDGQGPAQAAYFSAPTIAHLRAQGHEVTISNTFDGGLCYWADLVWSEWTNELAFALAKSPVCNRLVLRMRGYDVWYPLDRLKWSNVHSLVFESEFLRKLTEERFPSLPVRTAVIPSGIDLARFPLRPEPVGRPGKPVVALVARATAYKGYQLAFEWARSRPDVQLHVTTLFGEQDPRFMYYLRYAAAHIPNVTIHGAVDTAAWLSSIDANCILSASTFETLGYSIAEGMAMGCKPLINDCPGVRDIWPAEWIWRGLEELNALVDGPCKPLIYRAHVASRLDGKECSERFAELAFGDLQPRQSPPQKIRKTTIDTRAGHVLAIQTSPREPAYLSTALASLDGAGIARWQGPRIVIADGYVPDVRGWSVSSSAQQLGQAQTFFRLMREAAAVPGFSALTLLEDDVVLACNALDYIASVECPSNSVFIAWYGSNIAMPRDVAAPSIVEVPLKRYRSNCALTLPAATVHRLLSSAVVNNWTLRSNADLVYQDVFVDGSCGVHFPSLAQHVGAVSTVRVAGDERRTQHFYSGDAMALLP